MTKEEHIFSQLDRMFEGSPQIKLGKKSKIIIFSDLHVGNGVKRKDDFHKNSKMFMKVIDEYYNKNDFSLVLNGDIEELLKFHPHAVKKRWQNLYDLLGKFHDDKRLVKIIGNHEENLAGLPKTRINSNVQDSLVLKYKKDSIFIFHGHQAVEMFDRFSRFFGIILKFLAAPLGIKNRTASHSSKRKYQVEARAYRFSSRRKIVSILGHTHRPLFESFSKYDALRFSIERLLRDYPIKKKNEKKEIENKILQMRSELENMTKKEKDPKNSFYHEYLIYPCLFNSGCVIGRRGMTGIEIEGDRISLIHWYDKDRKKRAWKISDSVCVLDKKYHKRVLNSDNLDYIFNRIKLLG